MKREISNKFQSIFSGLIIATLFMPYAYGVLPIVWIFEIGYLNPDKFFINLIIITIPLLLIVPYFFLTIIKNLLNHKRTKIIKFTLTILCLINNFLCIFLFFNNNLNDYNLLIAATLSLGLLVLNRKYSKEINDFLNNIILAIIMMPITIYLLGLYKHLEYGGYIINICFFALYFITLYSLLKKRKVSL